ncbi:hypothetical protein AYI70_g9538, partial [Smittium culicis]
MNAYLMPSSSLMRSMAADF